MTSHPTQFCDFIRSKTPPCNRSVSSAGCFPSLLCFAGCLVFGRSCSLMCQVRQRWALSQLRAHTSTGVGECCFVGQLMHGSAPKPLPKHQKAHVVERSGRGFPRTSGRTSKPHSVTTKALLHPVSFPVSSPPGARSRHTRRHHVCKLVCVLQQSSGARASERRCARLLIGCSWPPSSFAQTSPGSAASSSSALQIRPHPMSAPRIPQLLLPESERASE